MLAHLANLANVVTQDRPDPLDQQANVVHPVQPDPTVNPARLDPLARRAPEDLEDPQVALVTKDHVDPVWNLIF